jgi:hypothetical protein
MIPYHGTPITPDEAAIPILSGRHGMVSFANPQQVGLVAEVCQSFTFDNGAFPAWKGGRPLDVPGYYAFVEKWKSHPGFDWALIPDVIDGGEDENNELLAAWPFDIHIGVPVWHLHESLDRLRYLAHSWPRIALGSSAQYAVVGTPSWRMRMDEVMAVLCRDGVPLCKLHGLRMLNPKIFRLYPFASADSTNVGRNIGIDKKWKGTYVPISKAARGIVIAGRVEAQQSAAAWGKVA